MSVLPYHIFISMSLFEKVLVKKPKRARFDFTHGNSVSMRFGMLTPTEVRFIVPGDEVAVSMEQIVRLSPMPVPTFVNMKVRHDFFFVPLSMMYSKMAMDNLLGTGMGVNARNRFRAASLGAYIKHFAPYTSPFVPSSLHDYLGYPVVSDANNASAVTEVNAFAASPSQTTYDAIWNALGTTGSGSVYAEAFPVLLEPLLAYHYIWRDYYRYTGLSVDSVPGNESWLENHVLNERHINYPVDMSNSTINNVTNGPGFAAAFQHPGSNEPATLTWSVFLGKPYYAHYKKDMYTSIRYGSKPVVLIPTGTSGTIPNLREASAAQNFVDLISVAGQRYWDKVKAVWNVTPEGMKDERVKFLARYQSFVKIGEVITTATTSDANTGDYAGRGLLIDGKYIFRRRFTEHGWLMCISSIVPDIHYIGFNRQLWDVNMLDTPIPQFANVGDQSVQRRELYFNWDYTGNGTVLGDQFRYYAYKSASSEVHGDFLMNSFKPWTAAGKFRYGNNIIDMTKVQPNDWNEVFTGPAFDSPIFGSRFYLDLTFHEYITRSLPKYIAYSL